MPIQNHQNDLVSGVLEIDLGAIVANYAAMQAQAPEAKVSAAVKADAYGLGMDRVAPALWKAGCTDYFVATIEEGVALRSILTEAKIYVLNGIFAGQETAFSAFSLTPVINSFEEGRLWRDFAVGKENLPGVMLHVDTGMNRLGVPIPQVEKVMALQGLDIAGVMSHLACANTPQHALNEQQLTSFQTVRRMLPDVPASLANSGGVFLGQPYHFDMVRVGIALFGGAPQPLVNNPIQPVVRLKVRILQERDIPTGGTIGYGAAYEATSPRRVVTLASGYADGFPTGLSNSSQVIIGDHRAPVVGRVSMDLMTVDVTHIPLTQTTPGNWAELIGPEMSIEAVADAGNMIPYELLTGLGQRYRRVYTE